MSATDSLAEEKAQQDAMGREITDSDRECPDCGEAGTFCRSRPRFGLLVIEDYDICETDDGLYYHRQE